MTTPLPQRYAGRRPGYLVCQWACQLLFAYYFRLRIFGGAYVPRQGGALLVCNHQSFLDPVLAAVGLPRECDFVARDTLFRQPLFAALIRYLNAIPIKRGEADVGAIKETIRRLRDGRAVVVFPEATRTATGAVAPMQPGTALIARKVRVPMIPTRIDGAFEAWPRQSKYPLPCAIRVAYGAPLTPADLQSLSDEEAIAEVRRRILALAPRQQAEPRP